MSTRGEQIACNISPLSVAYSKHLRFSFISEIARTKLLYNPVVAPSNDLYLQKSVSSFRPMTTASGADPISIEGNATASPNVHQPQRIKFKRLDKTAKHIMNILDKEAVDSVRASREIPDIKPGYIIQLKVEVPENKRRVSTLKGIVIARRNAGLNTTFRLRRMVAGVGVESVFPLYSPNIKEVKVIDKKKVRRAKLYYLRDRMNALKK